MSALVFQRAGWSNATGHRLSLWRVGTVERSRILVSRCSGLSLLHLLAREGVLLDVRNCSPATERAATDPTDRAAVKIFREQVRRALKELAPVAPLLAHAIDRMFKILSNVAFLQYDARSPEIVVTRDSHVSNEKIDHFDKVPAL